MARTRAFDRGVALRSATDAFWAKGYAATSTEDLLLAMGIGRQSLYDTFGDKRALYVEALEAYQRESTQGHLARLDRPHSPLLGIRDLLYGLIAEDDARRAMGCMGVGSVAEFGDSDPQLCALREQSSTLLRKRLIGRLRDGQRDGEIATELDPSEAAAFIQLTMTGIQLAARGGSSIKQLRTMARFAVDRLKAR
jgi:TetR/AcrR family transcriptional repressor of nem operon